ncbi:MAG: glycoside hydrolase family 2 protein [Bacteroidales bacterium]|nr:glycoside hydrolase family 2 protein [Bacteroidales bacterium]
MQRFVVRLVTYCALCLFAMALFCSCRHRMEAEQAVCYLGSDHGGCWEFFYKGKWYPATVPGNIYSDLLANRLIPDPLYGTNEARVQWVAEREWRYRLRFDSEKSWHGAGRRYLTFEGLDTYAEVWLNGTRLKTEDGEDHCYNMFRTWRFPLSDTLLQPNNLLEVRFRSTKAYNDSCAKAFPYGLRDNRVFTRNAQYMAGWDWGPSLLGCGIWKDVKIECYDDVEINGFYIKDIKTSLDGGTTWLCEVQAIVISEKAQRAKVNLEVSLQGNPCTVVRKTVRLDPGLNDIGLSFSIGEPKLWWPRGMGGQPLYDCRLTVGNASRSVRHGLRVVELRQQKDSIGESFTFYVNGKPVFARGANWVPASPYPGELQRKSGDAVYRRLLGDACAANMNMLRVWGGGFYEKDIFYDLCDSLGLLVWQDFMFACSPYFVDSAFLLNVWHEGEQLVRLGKHPCIALWCGNNEVHNCMEDWHLQERFGYPDDFFDSMKVQYRLLFEERLAGLVDWLQPGCPYIHSTPTFGWEHDECTTHGCSHYYGVWSGEQPFSVWESKTGRFMSEYGFQSYPEMATWKAAMPEKEWKAGSPSMLSHQKHKRGYEFVSKAIADYFGIDKVDNLEDFTYLSQLVQAYGIGQAIEAHRRQRERCSGTLYWQLNDCWPVASWSSIDGAGRWKLLHYRVRELYDNVAILTSQDNPSVIYLVNDSMKSIKGVVECRAYAMDGSPLMETVRSEVTLAPGRCHDVLRLDSITMQMLMAGEGCLHVTFSMGRKVRAERVVFMAPPKSLHLQDSAISVRWQPVEGGLEATLSSPVLQYGVQLSATDDSLLRFSDNGFTLLPGQQKTVRVTGNSPNPSFILVRSYNSLQPQTVRR